MATGMAPAPADSLRAAIERAAALLGADPAAAEREARAALSAAPRDPRAALILASARRRQGDAAGARQILEPLASAYPNAALTQYELGVARAATGDGAGAVAALNAAARLNRDHTETWQALGEALFAAGDGRGAEAAFAQARRAASPPALRPAADALAAGRLAEAEAALRRQLSARPNDAPALTMLAEAVARQGLHADAELLLAGALELDPAAEGTRLAYATALFNQQKAAEAIPQVERLLAADPASAAYRNLMAACLALVGEHARALTLYETLLAAYERQPQLWLNYGHGLRTVGRADEAVAAFRRALALDPGLADAYLGLANLKTAVFTDAELAAMRQAAARPGLSPDDAAALGFALGKALEDSGDAAGAFEHYAKGARARRAQTPYRAADFTTYVETCARLFDTAFFASRAGFGAPQADPIFIVGLPRSGSTLIEQILASHSAAEGTMELPDVGFAARGLGWLNAAAAPPGYPASLAELDGDEARQLGEGYLAATAIHRKLGRPRFIDKMPNNFQHLALIRLMLPNAKVIDARRHPLATCFSAFKQHFAQGQAFSYDLGDLGAYYRDYVRLMARVDAALPGYVCRVIYEDLVDDTESEVRRLLAYLDLPFEAACLRFYENDRAVRTVSSEQVRRPIYREGLEQWRRFEPWLGPLKEALGPALEGWRG